MKRRRCHQTEDGASKVARATQTAGSRSKLGLDPVLPGTEMNIKELPLATSEGDGHTPVVGQLAIGTQDHLPTQAHTTLGGLC